METQIQRSPSFGFHSLAPAGLFTPTRKGRKRDCSQGQAAVEHKPLAKPLASHKLPCSRCAPLLVADMLLVNGPFDDITGWLSAIVIVLAFGYLHWEDEPSSE